MQAEYDLIVVGGGLAGAALARSMAERGYRVLVTERDLKFKDRVRGEALVPWGVAEAELLGIGDLLRSSCAHELVWFDQYAQGFQFDHRPLKETTAPRRPVLTFYHPQMQEVLLASAGLAGVEIQRGAAVTAVRPGTPAQVSIATGRGTQETTARLVVGADGRTSSVRSWSGFKVHRDPERVFMAGLLFENLPAQEDAAHLIYHYDRGSNVVFFPQGGGRVRCYFVYQANSQQRLQGDNDIPRFVQNMLETGAKDYFQSAVPAGPLASFDCADTWTDHPYRDGVALIGDAACSSSPAWGQGMALSLRDVRVLRDQLFADADWDVAAHAYATQHDRYVDTIRKVTGWFSELFLDPGPHGQALRARAMPAIAQDPGRVPDHILSGPELPADDIVKQRFLGGSPGESLPAAATA